MLWKRDARPGGAQNVPASPGPAPPLAPSDHGDAPHRNGALRARFGQPWLAAMMGCGVWAAGTPRSSAAPGRVAAQACGGRGCAGGRPGGAKRAETAFDAASDQFTAAEQALDAAREQRARARQERYAARQAHDQAELAVRRLRRRADEVAGRLDGMA